MVCSPVERRSSRSGSNGCGPTQALGLVAVNPDRNWVVELADPQGNVGYLSIDGTWADTIGPARWFASEQEARAAEIPNGMMRRITRMM